MVDIAPPAQIPHRTGVALVFAAGCLWSTVGLGVRLIDQATVWQILLYRSASLGAFLFVVLYLRSNGRPFTRIRAVGAPGALGGLALVAAYAGGVYALQAASVAQVMLLFATAPFMAAVLGWLVLGERVRRVTWAAIALAMAGIAVMFADQTGGAAWSGSAAALGSALGFAVFTVALRSRKEADMLPSVFLSGVFGVILMGLACWRLDLPISLSLNDSAIALGMGVFQVGLGLVLYTLGSKTVPAAELTLLSMAEVLLGPIWVWMFLGETATANTLYGGAILLFAIAANAVLSARRP